MYAIIADSGRQFRVEQGMELEVDLRAVKAGEEIKFEQVLVVSSDAGFKLGTPNVAGAVVTATVLGDTQGDKVYVQKFRRRKNSRRRTGHRQKYTKVKIVSISA